MTELKITALVDRTVLVLTGTDVWDFLQNLITNNMQAVSDTKCLYAALLTAQGKFLHDFFVVKSGDSYLLDCEKARKDDLIRRLTLYKLRADVTIAEGTQKIHALFGEEAPKAVNLPASVGTVIRKEDVLYLIDPRSVALGVRIIAPADFDPAAALPETTAVPTEDYNTLRLNLGIPEGGRDIVPEKNFLLEANFEELNGVSFTKGCYVGQELTARTKHRAKIKKRLLRVEYDGALQEGDKIMQQGREIGEIRSFANGQGLALVRLENLTTPPDELEPAGVKLIRPEYLDPSILTVQ